MINIKQLIGGSHTSKKEMNNRKRRYNEISKKKLELKMVRALYPKGNRYNRVLYLKKLENKKSFQKDLDMMKQFFLSKK